MILAHFVQYETRQDTKIFHTRVGYNKEHFLGTDNKPAVLDAAGAFPTLLFFFAEKATISGMRINASAGVEQLGTIFHCDKKV